MIAGRRQNRPWHCVHTDNDVSRRRKSNTLHCPPHFPSRKLGKGKPNEISTAKMQRYPPRIIPVLIQQSHALLCNFSQQQQKRNDKKRNILDFLRFVFQPYPQNKSDCQYNEKCNRHYAPFRFRIHTSLLFRPLLSCATLRKINRRSTKDTLCKGISAVEGGGLS